MTTIQDHLCWYDPRNPSYTLRDCGYRSPRKPGCLCDPCFEGRDRLAGRLLDAINMLKGCGDMLDDYYPTRTRELRDAIRRLEEPLP